MHLRIYVSVILGCFAFFDTASSADPATAWNDCIGLNKLPFERVIEGCTEIIREGQVTTVKMATAYNNRGLVHKLKGEYDLALQDYNEAIRLLPNSAIHYNNRGVIYRLKHDYDRAIADYDEAIWLDSDYPAAFYNRALAYSDKGDYAHALEDFGVVLQFNPRNALALYARGKTLSKSGNTQAAMADFAAAKAIDPDVDKKFDQSQ